MAALRRAAAAFAALGCLAAAGGAVAAELPTGLWQVPGSSVTMQFTTCGGNLCALLMNSKVLQTNPAARDEKNPNPALRTRPLKGITFLWGLKGGPPNWTGGHFYAPGNGQTYGVTLALVDADNMTLKGCLAPGLCKTQGLKRVR